MTMKFYIRFMKFLYFNSEIFQKCSVCLPFDFVSCLSFEEESCTELRKVSNKYCIVIAPVEQS